MMLRQFIESRINHLYVRSLNCFLDICYFLRSFIDQQNNQMYLRIVSLDRLCHFLKKCGLTCLGRGHDHTTLSLTYRAEQIHDPHGNAGTGQFKMKALIGENRSHILKIPSPGCLLRRIAVNALYEQKSCKLLSLGFDSGISLQNISCF